MEGVSQVIEWIVQFFMVFGGILPYLPQYKTIWSSKNADGFSRYVCLVLLVANIMRILFWYGKQFELTLLFQSVVMIVVMMGMLHICTYVSERESIHRIFELRWFWQWTYFIDYCLFVLIISCVGCCITYFATRYSLYVEGIGTASLMTEACLGLPQFIKNYSMKSTKGMSVGMVLLWLTGDSIKTIYFFVKTSPLQFLICGVIQCLVDISVLLQVGLY